MNILFLLSFTIREEGDGGLKNHEKGGETFRVDEHMKYDLIMSHDLSPVREVSSHF